jgi:SAM-dependent methyltransferase
MGAEQLLGEISDYCRKVGMAESTFGRRAVNDGKFVSRLRIGGRITTETVERVRSFIQQHPTLDSRKFGRLRSPMENMRTALSTGGAASKAVVPATPVQPQTTAAAGNFRFYDNRQKYLLFVNTCSEKWVIAQRVSMELANIHPRPPAVRLFDAGVGDGTVLARVMRAMHTRFPTVPFHIVGKEISLEDVRLALDRMPDRFFEHPATVLVMTNLYYSEAPWLSPKSVTAATSLVWHEVALTGNTASEFEAQITDLQPFLSEHWKARVSQASGNLVYEKPVVLVIYREDYRFLLDQIRPQRGAARAEFDLVIASQPYRARASVEFKAKRVLAPLARSLAPGGRMIAIHSHGNDPGLEIIQRVWPGENPFQTDRHALLKATRAELGSAGRDLNFGAYADNRSLFRYEMHTLPNEISETIGTSTLLAAWNAAIYVAQIEDQRLDAVMGDRRYLEATQEVLHKHGALWFLDESFVISRKRD